MYRASITEALLGTVVIFNTVFSIPKGTSLPEQIFGASVVFGVLLALIETARDWEKKNKKKSAGRQPERTNNKELHRNYKIYKGEMSR